MGPDHRHIFGARQCGYLIDVIDLLRVGLIGGFERIDIGIGSLQIDVDDSSLGAEPEPCAIGVALDLFPVLPGSQIR